MNDPYLCPPYQISQVQGDWIYRPNIYEWLCSLPRAKIISDETFLELLRSFDTTFKPPSSEFPREEVPQLPHVEPENFEALQHTSLRSVEFDCSPSSLCARVESIADSDLEDSLYQEDVPGTPAGIDKNGRHSMQAFDPVTNIGSSEDQILTPLITPVIAEDLENEGPEQSHTEGGTLPNGAALSVSQVTVQEDIQMEGATRHKNQKTKHRVRDISRPITYWDCMELLMKPEANSDFRSFLRAHRADATLTGSLNSAASWLEDSPFVIRAKMEIPGQIGDILEVKLILDTGATFNVVSQRVAEILQPGYTSAPGPIAVDMVGTPSYSRGVIPVRWRSSNEEVPEFVVSEFHITDAVDTTYDAIMGAKDISRLKLLRQTGFFPKEASIGRVQQPLGRTMWASRGAIERTAVNPDRTRARLRDKIKTPTAGRSGFSFFSKFQTKLFGRQATTPNIPVSATGSTDASQVSIVGGKFNQSLTSLNTIPIGCHKVTISIVQEREVSNTAKRLADEEEMRRNEIRKRKGKEPVCGHIEEISGPSLHLQQHAYKRAIQPAIAWHDDEFSVPLPVNEYERTQESIVACRCVSLGDSSTRPCALCSIK